MSRLIFFFKLIPFKVLLFIIELRDKPDRILKGSGTSVSKHPGKWEKAAPLPSWRYEFSGDVLGDEIFLIGGVVLPSVWFPTRLAEAYNFKKDTWRKIAPCPILVHHTGVVECNKKLYVVGGNGIRIIPRSNVYEYDVLSDKWIRRADLPYARGALGVVEINNSIYAAGGATNKIPLNILNMYDPKTDSWTTLSSMPTAREHVAAVAAEGRMFVLGGYAGNRFNNLTANEVYDPKTDKWKKLSPLPYPVSGLAAAVVGGSIFIFGGEQGWAVSSEVHEYIINRDKWVRRRDMPVARYALTATSVNKEIHVIGGNSVIMGYDFRRDHDIFTP